MTFTGSVDDRHAASRKPASTVMRKFQLEMGGKNPTIVLDDADLKVAVGDRRRRAPSTRPASAAPRPRALIVTEGIHDQFVAALTERIRNLEGRRRARQGHRDRPGGRPGQLKQDTDYIEIGKSEGAKLAVGGELVKLRQPWLLPAAGAVHRGDATRCASAREEIFGPVAAVIRVKDYEEALADCQRYRVRPVGRHRHHVAEIRHALQAQRRSRHGDGQRADRRRRFPRAASAAARARATARASRASTPPSSSPR